MNRGGFGVLSKRWSGQGAKRVADGEFQAGYIAVGEWDFERLVHGKGRGWALVGRVT